MESNEEQDFLECEVCDLPQHVKGKKHKKQVRDKKRQADMNSFDSGEEQNLKEDKDSDAEEYICHICEMAFSEIVPYTQHLSSGPHAKTLRRKKADDSQQLENGGDSEVQGNNDVDLSNVKKGIAPESFGACFICEKQFNGPEAYSQHMRSKSHAKRQSEKQTLKKIKSAGEAVGQSLECKYCKNVFTDVSSFAQHLKSKEHNKGKNQNKLLEERKVGETQESEGDSPSSGDQELLEALSCKICEKTFSGPEDLNAHTKSKTHEKVDVWKKSFAKEGKPVELGSRNSELQMPAKPGSISADVLREKPSVPPLTDSEGEYQEANDQMESKSIDQNQDSFTTEDSKSSCPALAGDSHDVEKNNVVTEEGSVISVD